MPAIACPQCGEADDLAGTRQPDGSLEITCQACGAAWERGSKEPRCRLCGSDDLEYTTKPLWEKGRGEQRTPVGRIHAYYCHACGGRDVTSASPVPGPPDHTPSRRVD